LHSESGRRMLNSKLEAFQLHQFLPDSPRPFTNPHIKRKITSQALTNKPTEKEIEIQWSRYTLSVVKKDSHGTEKYFSYSSTETVYTLGDTNPKYMFSLRKQRN
jgi:hypothetical protein